VTVHRFDDSLAWGEQAAHEPFWDAIFRKAFPDFVSMASNSSHNSAQYRGIDRWVHLSSGQTLTIDIKARGKERPDILLEVISNDRTNTPGWIEKDLAIDFLAYGFVESRVAYLFPWQSLRRAWRTNREAWTANAHAGRDGFFYAKAPNPGYHTHSVCVPTRALRGAVATALMVTLDSPRTDAPRTDAPRNEQRVSP